MRKRQGRNYRKLKQAVRRGVALLDERLPDWKQLVRIKEFDFTDPCKCVVGTIGRFQLDSNCGSRWDRGKESLGLESDAGVKYCGFDWEHQDEAPILSRLWLRELRRQSL